MQVFHFSKTPKLDNTPKLFQMDTQSLWKRGAPRSNASSGSGSSRGLYVKECSESSPICWATVMHFLWLQAVTHSKTWTAAKCYTLLSSLLHTASLVGMSGSKNVFLHLLNPWTSTVTHRLPKHEAGFALIYANGRFCFDGNFRKWVPGNLSQCFDLAEKRQEDCRAKESSEKDLLRLVSTC